MNAGGNGLPAGVRWDDLRTFLTASEQGSFRSAARVERVAVNTVRDRVARLEDVVGLPLLWRSGKGCRTTPAGDEFTVMVRRMRAQAGRSAGDRQDALICPARSGSASEAIGSGWLTPRLMELQREFPDLTVALMCDYDIATDRSAEIDVGIAWHPPTNPDLIVAKLASLHFMAFASHGYLREKGTPERLDQLLDHRYIEQAAPGVKTGLLDQIVGTDRPSGFIPIRTNSSLALFYAVVSGAGIALMPTYAAAVTRKLAPIDLPIQLRFDLQYYYHPEAKNSPAVQAAVGWLRRLFDPAKYPFFRSEFVHPRDFLPATSGDNIVRLFEPFVEMVG